MLVPRSIGLKQIPHLFSIAISLLLFFLFYRFFSRLSDDFKYYFLMITTFISIQWINQWILYCFTKYNIFFSFSSFFISLLLPFFASLYKSFLHLTHGSKNGSCWYSNIIWFFFLIITLHLNKVLSFHIGVCISFNCLEQELYFFYQEKHYYLL